MDYSGSTGALFRNLRGAVAEGYPGNLACSRTWKRLTVYRQPGLIPRLRPLPRHQGISPSEPDRVGLFRCPAVRLILITVIFTSLSWHCSHGRGKLC